MKKYISARVSSIVMVILVSTSCTPAQTISTPTFDKAVRVTKPTSGLAPNGVVVDPKISANGGVIAFTSKARNLVSPPSDSSLDIFYYRESTGSVQQIHRNATGSGASGDALLLDMTPDGKNMVFSSGSLNRAPHPIRNSLRPRTKILG